VNRLPHLFGDPAEVAAEDRGDRLGWITPLAECVVDPQQDFGRHEVDRAPAGVAVGKQVWVGRELAVEVLDVEGEVGGQPDVVGADEVDGVVDVPAQRVQRGVVGAEEDADARCMEMCRFVARL